MAHVAAASPAPMSGAGELRERVLRGGLWTGISYAASRGLAFAQTVILARLLLPEDLGLMGVAMFAVGGLNAFTQVGVDLALIRGASLERRDLDTGWAVSVCRGVLLAAVTFGSAPLVAEAFGDDRVGPVLRALSATFLFEGFLNVGVVVFRRDLDFRRQTIFEQVSESLTTFVTVGAALVTRNVWALVVGQVAGVFFRTVSSYVLSPFRPAFRADREALRGLLGYGRHVTVTGILLFFLMQGDNAFVGRFLGAAALGLYALAYNLANLPSSAIASVVARLAFPVYASMQDDPGSLRRGYLRSVRIVVLFTLPASLLLLTLAPDLVPGLYGERWRSAVPVVQILSVFGFLKAFNTAPGSFLQATGHPERLQRVMLIQLILFGLMLVPMGRVWGIAGVGVAVTAGNLAAAGVVVWQVRRAAGIGFGAHLRAAWPAIPSGAAMGGAALAVVSVMRDAAWGWRAGSAAGAGLFVYAAALLAVDGDLRREGLGRLGRRNR